MSATITALTLYAFCGRCNFVASWSFSSIKPSLGRRIAIVRREALSPPEILFAGRPSYSPFVWPERDSRSNMSSTSTKRGATSSNEEDDIQRQYFLLKSEPSEYSIDDLQRDVQEEWDGIRNYQARNYLRSMNVGDRAFFYHSKTSPPGIVGTVKIVRTAQPDPTAYDPKSEYYDKKSTKENCRWDSVLVEYEQTFPVVLTLKDLKEAALNDPDGAIANMALFKQSRLSVVPLTVEQWTSVMRMVEEKSSFEGREEKNTNEEK